MEVIMDFTEKELQMILHCASTAVEWSLHSSEPGFYETIDSIATKCRQALPVTDKPVKKLPVKSAYIPPKVTTSLGGILKNLKV